MFPHVRGKRGRYSVSDRGSRNSGVEDHGYLKRGSGGGEVGASVYPNGTHRPGGQEVNLVYQRQSSSVHLKMQVMTTDLSPMGYY